MPARSIRPTSSSGSNRRLAIRQPAAPRTGHIGRSDFSCAGASSVFNVASAELSPDPSSVPVARQLVADMAARLPRRAREAAELVTSELVTNSVIHAKTTFEVFAAVDDDAFEVVVADRAGWAPTSQDRTDGGR